MQALLIFQATLFVPAHERQLVFNVMHVEH